jgi:acyl-CoA synthetase (NDP forming)
MIQEAVEHFRASQVPEYRFPERAASALAILAQRAEFLTRDQTPPPRYEDVNHQAVQSLLESCNNDPSCENIVLPQDIALRILDAYRIPTLSLQLAKPPKKRLNMPMF